MIFTWLSGQAIAAAAGGDFTVHPTYLHEGNKSWIISSIPAGKTVTDFITLENFSDNSQTLKLEIYEASEKNDVFTPSNSKKYADIGNWIKIPETIQHLKPHEKKKVPVIFSIPENAQNKKYMAVIYAIQNKEGANNIRFVTRIGVRIYLTVTGPVIGQTNLFNSPEYANIVFFILSLAGVMGSIFYNLIHFLESKKYEKESLQ